MDSLDLKVLSLLNENARVSASHISEEVLLSVSSVIERIKKLETAGVIEQYTIKVNQEKLGTGLEALMEISLEHPTYHEPFTEFIKANSNVVACHYLTGKIDFLLRIFATDIDALEQIQRSIKSFKGVSATNTHVVLKTVKNDYCFIPSDDE